jgi:acyl-CoA synthetase (NDP forming)/GNAT superfamily N-acetyltransferase
MFSVIPDGSSYREFVLLKDGQSLLFRAAAPEDAPAVEQLLQRASVESLQMRFMGSVAHLSRSFIEDMCINDPRHRFCILAIQGEAPDHRVIAAGNYGAMGGRTWAEVAFLVADEFQGLGISTLLLERLAGVAAGHGYLGFEAGVLYDNHKMIHVFRDSGFEVKQAFDGGSIHIEFPVRGAAVLRERGELRERIAAANSVMPLLRPSRVAVVGASRDPASLGSMIFRHMLNANFRGTVYPVNHAADAINGVRAYPSLLKLPDPVDLVIVAVPASHVLEVAEHALRAGARALLVVSSGFAETGPEGAALQAKLVDLVRSHGARLVGPNCLGIMNTDPDICLNGSLATQLPPPGRIAFFSHSAALGLVIMNDAVERGLGLSSVVTAGNRADISGNDLLQYWEEDPNTAIILLYLETFGNPRRFSRIARRVTQRKPILCVKSARSTIGHSAARAHTGAQAQGDQEATVLFHQAGVIRANTLEEMFDVAVLLDHQPLPKGNRVAIISNSGGVVTLCADACDACGLEVDPAQILDLGAMASAEAYSSSVASALQASEVDALIVIFACVGNCDALPIRAAILHGVEVAEATTRNPKPVLLCLMGARGTIELETGDAAQGTHTRTFPSYRYPESAAMALGHVAHYAAYRRMPPGRLLWFDDVESIAARQRIEEMALTPAVSWLDQAESLRLLLDFRIPTAPSARPEPEAIRLSLRVRSDPHFGPVIGLQRPGYPPEERITPLMDSDVQAMAQALDLPPPTSLGDCLGRLSQLVEELPWVTEIQGEVVLPPTAETPALVYLAPGVRIGLRQPSAP